MTLKMKTAGLIGITMAAFIILIFLFMRPVILNDAKLMDEESLETDQERVESYIESEKMDLQRFNRDWAVWDDSYTFMQNRSEAYIRSNLIQETFENSAINLMVFINTKGEVIYANGYDLTDGTELDLASSLQQVPEIIEEAENGNGLVIIEDSSFGSVMVAVDEILGSEGQGPSTGRLASGIFLDESFFNTMRNTLALDVQVVNKEAGDLKIQELDEKTLSSLIAVSDGLTLELKKDRKYYQQKSSSMNGLFLALAIATVILVVLVYYLIDMLVLSRISHLSVQLKDVDFDKAHSLEVENSRNVEDEITDLENSIQNMLISLEKAHTDVSKLAFFDQLTGLPNRFSLYKDFLKRIEKNDTSFAILFFDLDGFKRINDLYGHNSGDEVLKQIGRRLNGKSLRKGSRLYRIGGDEFILISNTTERTKLSEEIAEVMAAIQKVFNLGKVTTSISASIGVSFYPANARTLDDLLQYADVAMYAAKKNGKNHFVFYEDITDKHLYKYLLNLKNDLADAIANNEFFLEYQPIMDNKGERIQAVEALIRWNHPKEGLIAPLRFIPLAEETGMMKDIGDWVIRNAVKDLQKWNQENGQSLSLAINVSKAQLRFKKELIELIDEVLEEQEFPAHQLQIEITESDTAAEHEEIVDFINELKRRNIQVALDDFGVGTSSLYHLLELDVDIVKIDRSFLRQVPASEKDTALLKGIYSTLYDLNIQLVTEGIETEEQRDFVSAKNGSYLQGFYFSKPVLLEELKKMQEAWEKTLL
ncbi:Cyclic di-GMP phosphodiesterase Gmr [Planococcus massiliensis]|uniref:Cyclic di-GMP phosphodiesterase Gmr n=1 Tax=Planococcus massiliensis TaxID=1499687 RepID=A0A098EJ62_9BACL|nr:EAL domain-containing protein [Planococcus massiliensis]CEG21341.1 Cyclic di-GMP phosphodiesterase Gmr [Planococcus massiliensis]